jgi:hypothetical protein
LWRFLRTTSGITTSAAITAQVAKKMVMAHLLPDSMLPLVVVACISGCTDMGLVAPCGPTRDTSRVLVHATWQRHVPGVSVRAFLDRSYLIDFGFASHKPPFLTVGWYRWHPDFIELDRTRMGLGTSRSRCDSGECRIFSKRQFGSETSPRSSRLGSTSKTGFSPLGFLVATSPCNPHFAAFPRSDSP